MRPGAYFEVFDDRHNLCLKVDAAMFLDFLSTQIRAARWVAAISAEPMNALAMERLELEMGEPPVIAPPEPRKPLTAAPARAIVPPERREALREKRRARKR